MENENEARYGINSWRQLESYHRGVLCMRRGPKVGQLRPTVHRNTMSRELDWLVDQWADSPADVKLQLVLAKIRAEENAEERDKRKII